ncbi:DNA alkylation repair protein [Micromonospora sp. NBC_01796]|uniref:DNA alkylation repair protein n=1 Tax=Micromonospora sp. NBC_01796 TaxID=2975987 RepID=UPI002DD8EB91|nr:DNA alkylation repair protein [Micromonospora sp. NBC_01796]WSA84403.1 DNA alkylation repair protein [Micromonospora sp. NBC_01796]
MPTADELISTTTVTHLVRVLADVAPRRRWDGVAASGAALVGLTLSERALAIRDALLADLPDSYRSSAAILRDALADPSFTGWMIWPVTEAVAVRALASPEAGDFESGLGLLAELTGRLTGEFALRTFLNADLDRTLATVIGWTTHPDEHVRRLASEGTRPRLPWAKRVPELTRRPDATVAILDALYRDEVEYVRRSVANHLNDLSRLDPELAVTTATRWLERPEPSTPRLVRHAMRTLVKAADPDALALLGFPPPVGVVVTGPHLDRTAVPLGGEVGFEIVVGNNGDRDANLVVDYVVHFRKANGSLAPKVFKLANRVLAPGQQLTLSRRHSFKPITTRRYHPGQHAIEVQVNGVRSGMVDFDLG